MSDNKFKHWLQNINKLLISHITIGKDYDFDNQLYELPIIIIKKSHNEGLMHTVFNIWKEHYFHSCHDRMPFSGDLFNPWHFDKDCNDIKNLSSMIYELNHSISIIYSEDDVNKHNRISISPPLMVLYIIFWNLLFVVVSNEDNHKKLADIADLACCFGINEPIMEDLCKGVKSIINGEQLASTVFSTSWCKKFFTGSDYWNLRAFDMRPVLSEQDRRAWP